MNRSVGLRCGAFLVLTLEMLVSTAWAQTQNYPAQNTQPGQAVQRSQAAQPDQPVQPQIPTLERRASQQPGVQQPAGQAAQQPPPPPFTLTAEQAAEVDRVLKQWEEHNDKIKTFDCIFTRWVYLVVGPANSPNTPPLLERGVLRYHAPDRGLFHIQATAKDNKWVAIAPERAEHWVSNGKSVFELRYIQKQIIEHKLPPEAQGKAIANTPLPFLFGATAEKLKQRYWIRIVTPADDVGKQIWLEAVPRFLAEAGNFHRAQFIVDAKNLNPIGLILLHPNDKDHSTYKFDDVVVNDPLRIFKIGDPFNPVTPSGWQKIVEDAPPSPQAQAQMPQNAGPRR